MISADVPSGVVARMLDNPLPQLRQALRAFRAELHEAEAAFSRWEARWKDREREIDTRLGEIQSRLNSCPATQVLTLVGTAE